MGGCGGRAEGLYWQAKERNTLPVGPEQTGFVSSSTLLHQLYLLFRKAVEFVHQGVYPASFLPRSAAVLRRTSLLVGGGDGVLKRRPLCVRSRRLQFRHPVHHQFHRPDVREAASMS